MQKTTVYRCSVCGGYFTEQNDCIKHEKIHKTEFKIVDAHYDIHDTIPAELTLQFLNSDRSDYFSANYILRL